MPTSITAAPAFTISAVTMAGRPTATTSTSASRVWPARSRVCEWQTVTVAFACSSSCAVGLPTIALRPTTTASAPSSSIRVLGEQGHHAARGRRHEARPPVQKLARVRRVEAVDVLRRVDGADDVRLVDTVPEAAAGRAARRSSSSAFSSATFASSSSSLDGRRQPQVDGADPGLGRGLVLEPDVDVRGRIVADEHRRQPDAAERAHVLRDVARGCAPRVPCRPSGSQPSVIEPIRSGAAVMIALVFSYEVSDAAEFERVYGPEGDWAEFFRRGRGYVGTELLRDIEHPGALPRDRPLGVGRGLRRVRRREPRRVHAAVDDTAFLYQQELRFGTFESVWNAG